MHQSPEAPLGQWAKHTQANPKQSVSSRHCTNGRRLPKGRSRSTSSPPDSKLSLLFQLSYSEDKYFTQLTLERYVLQLFLKSKCYLLQKNASESVLLGFLEPGLRGKKFKTLTVEIVLWIIDEIRSQKMRKWNNQFPLRYYYQKIQGTSSKFAEGFRHQPIFLHLPTKYDWDHSEQPSAMVFFAPRHFKCFLEH